MHKRKDDYHDHAPGYAGAEWRVGDAAGDAMTRLADFIVSMAGEFVDLATAITEASTRLVKAKTFPAWICILLGLLCLGLVFGPAAVLILVGIFLVGAGLNALAEDEAKKL